MRGRPVQWILISLAAAFIVVVALVLPPGEKVHQATSTCEIKDMAGKVVALPCEVHRVVSAMYPIATQLMILVGARENLVGISDYDVNAVMRRIWPEIEGVPRPGRSAGGEVSVEEILALAPDLVFRHMHGGSNGGLEGLGIPSIVLCLENPEALMQGILLVGEVMQRRERAVMIVEYYRDRLAFIREHTRQIEPKKRVYFAGPHMLSTAGGDYYQHYVIEYAGGHNVAASLRGGWCSVSLEHLLEWNPDFIFIGNYGTARPEDFLEDKRLRDIAAVKNGDVTFAPYYIGSWDVPTPESILGIMWLANRLYPNQVDFDMASEIRRFYSLCYGYTPRADEVREVLGR